MRIAVLATSESWYRHDLERAAGTRHVLEDCGFADLRAALGDVAAHRVGTPSLDLERVDAVLVRTMPLGSLEQVVFRMNVLARVEQTGTIVLNPARSLEVAIDKYLALAQLADHGLMVPATVTCQSWQQAMDAFALLGGDVVVKPIFGGEGRGIARIDDPAFALRAFKMLAQLGAVIYLQEYIVHEGHDLRLLVIGNQVLGMRRSNPLDWRTNISLGAAAEPMVVEESLCELALTAATAVGCPLAGVDLLPAKNGELYVLEVNAVPGWKALAHTLRLDVAQLVLELLEHQKESSPCR